MAAPTPVAENYAQPTLTIPSGGGWKINSVDLQITTKEAAWNQDQTKRLAEFQVVKNLGANYVALGVPYDNATKFANYVADARTKGFKIFFRSHWNNWQGDNSTSADLSSQDYLDQTYDFIVNNPTLFEDGDLFATCVEANNANDTPNTTYPFRVGNVSGGTFSHALYSRFLRDQVTYANAAFLAIGKSVGTWPVSMSVTLLNLSGQELDGTSGDSSGLTDADIVNYFGGILTIDHYLSDSYRYGDDPSYWSKYSSDLDKIHTAFPSCKIMIGEWGYHTTTDTGSGEQHGMFEQIVDVLRSKTYIMGVNFWVHMGSNTASIFLDSGGTITPGARNTSNAIKRAFNTGNSCLGSRRRV